MRNRVIFVLLAICTLLTVSLFAEELCRDERGRFVKCQDPPVETDDPALAVPVEPVPPPTPAPLPPLPPYQAPEEEDSSPQVRVLIGGLVGLMTDSDARIEPMARIGVDWTVYDGDRPVRAHVIGDLTALPGDAIDLATPESFRALEFEMGLSWKPLEQVHASVYASGGFASRLQTRGHEPTYEAPKWASFGALFETKQRSAWLAVGMGPDQRLDGRYAMAVQVGGGLDLLRAESGRFEGTTMSLIVSAVLGLESNYTSPTRRDIVRVGTCLGWGR